MKAIGHEQVQVPIGKGGGHVTSAKLIMRRKGEPFRHPSRKTAVPAKAAA